VLTVQITRDTALAEIRRDYDSNYFVSGVGDMEAYEPDWCAPWRVKARPARSASAPPALRALSALSAPSCAVATLACSAQLCRALRSLCPDTARHCRACLFVWLWLKPCCRGPRSLFADPFAGFNGVERFKRNVSNLGGLMCGPARPVSSRPPLHALLADSGVRYWSMVSAYGAAWPAGLVPLRSCGAAGTDDRRCSIASRPRAPGRTCSWS